MHSDAVRRRAAVDSLGTGECLAMSFNGVAEEEYQGGAFADSNRNIPTPAAMPPMMQPYQGSYNAGYQQQGYGQQMGPDYSMIVPPYRLMIFGLVSTH